MKVRIRTKSLHNVLGEIIYTHEDDEGTIYGVRLLEAHKTYRKGDVVDLLRYEFYMVEE